MGRGGVGDRPAPGGRRGRGGAPGRARACPPAIPSWRRCSTTCPRPGWCWTPRPWSARRTSRSRSGTPTRRGEAYGAARRRRGRRAARCWSPNGSTPAEAERRQLLSSRPIVRLTPAVEPDGRALPEFRAERDPRAAAAAFVRERLQGGERVVLAAADERDRRRLRGLVGGRAGADAAALGCWSETRELGPGSLATLPAALPSGFRVPGLAVVAAADVLGPRPAQGGGAPAGGAPLAVGELRLGDHVVHAEHGIGRAARAARRSRRKAWRASTSRWSTPANSVCSCRPRSSTGSGATAPPTPK